MHSGHRFGFKMLYFDMLFVLQLDSIFHWEALKFELGVQQEHRLVLKMNSLLDQQPQQQQIGHLMARKGHASDLYKHSKPIIQNPQLN